MRCTTTNCRDPAAIAENFGIFTEIFRQAQTVTGIAPEALVFGSGFGVPYLPGETPLKAADVPRLFTTETFCKVVIRAQRAATA